MNNSINYKFHHISRAEYQELLAVSRGEAVADYIIDNVSVLDLINGGEISGRSMAVCRPLKVWRMGRMSIWEGYKLFLQAARRLTPSLMAARKPLKVRHMELLLTPGEYRRYLLTEWQTVP